MSSATTSAFGGTAADGYERIFESARDSWPKFADACAFADKGAGLALLDVGSGPGEPSCYLKNAFPEARVTCTDLEADMVAKAKVRAQRLAVQLDFAVCSAEHLSPFADESFDVVTANMVLMFPQNRCQMITEAMRVLKPDGRLIATVWKRFGLLDLMREVLNTCLSMSLPEPSVRDAHPLALRAQGAVEAVVAEAGFNLDSSEHYDVTFRWEGDEDQIKGNFLFVARRALQTLAEAERAEAGRKYVQCMFEEAAKRGWRSADGSFQFPGEHQMVVITKSQEAVCKKRKIGID